MSSLGVFTATIIGSLVDAPVITTEEGQRTVVRTRIATNTSTFIDGKRCKVESIVDLTAGGAAAENILNNYYLGKRCYVAGAMTLVAGHAVLHATQLLWIDGGS